MEKGKTPAAQVQRESVNAARRPRWYHWLLLAAGANGLLMATNNVVTLDAPVPLLWVVPLGIYLTTLIISFGPRAPSPRLQGILSGVGLAVIVGSLLLLVVKVHQQVAFIALNGAILWNGTLLCHARLARARPQDTRELGAYYLAISAGGWLGAVLVGILLPLAQRGVAISFLDYAEAFAIIVLAMLVQDGRAVVRYFRRRPSLAVSFLLLMGIGFLVGATAIKRAVQGQVYASRTFYGLYRVTDRGGLRWFQHGNTIHGVQSLKDAAGRLSTGYYHPDSPIAHIMVSGLPFRKVGIVGLGAGALAAYERPGQTWDFFELDPEVERIAREHFTYLRGAVAPTRVIIGDARLTLQHEPDGKFDLLVLDTFSSDFLPIHLMTLEAVELYFRKLAPGGLLVFHISSRMFDVAPVLERLAGRLGAHWAVSGKRGTSFLETPDGRLPSRWFAMTYDRDTFALLVNTLGWTGERGKPAPDEPVWTDDYVNLFDALLGR